MSCFIVSRETMQQCVSALHEDGREPREDADQLGQELFRLNFQAYYDRYPDMVGDPSRVGADFYADWTWRTFYPKLDSYEYPVDHTVACSWLKALHCLCYQLNEGDEVPEAILYKRVSQRIHEIEAHLARSLPEYKAAPWNFEDPSHTVETITIDKESPC